MLCTKTPTHSLLLDHSYTAYLKRCTHRRCGYCRSVLCILSICAYVLLLRTSSASYSHRRSRMQQQVLTFWRSTHRRCDSCRFLLRFEVLGGMPPTGAVAALPVALCSTQTGCSATWTGAAMCSCGAIRAAVNAAGMRFACAATDTTRIQAGSAFSPERLTGAAEELHRHRSHGR